MLRLQTKRVISQTCSYLRLVLVLLCLAIGHNPVVYAADQAQVYSFGIVPQFDARRIRTIWHPVLQTLKAETGLDFVIRGAPDISKFEQQFVAGKFDFAYMNPFHLVTANETQGYVPLVRDVGRSLYGVLVVPAEGGIESVTDLDGRIVAMPSPNALGASLLMRADMDDIHGIKIIPTYVKTHSSVYLNVILGEAAAGGGVQKTLNQQPPHIRDRLRVLYRTRDVVPHPVAAHSRIDQAVQAQVRDAFLVMGETTAGRELLAEIPILRIGATGLADYMPLKDLGLERYYSRE